MPTIRNGIGTAYFGATERRPDGSFVTTKWFVLLDVPLIPLRSERVRLLSSTEKVFKTESYYEIVEKVPLNGRMVGTVYAWGFGILALAAGVGWIAAAIHSVWVGLGAFIGYWSFWIWIFPRFYKAK